MAWFKRHAHPEDQLSAYLDGELNEGARRSVQAHLAGCELCSTLLGELRTTKSMLAELPQTEPRRSFALGPQYAVARRPERRSAFTFAPVAALTVFLALLAVDIGSLGSSSSDDATGGASTASSRQSESADKGAGAGDDMFVPAPTSGAGILIEPARAPAGESAADEAGQRDAFAAPGADTEDGDGFAPAEPPTSDKASSDGTSVLRILEAGAAVAFGASLLIVLWPRIRRRGEL